MILLDKVRPSELKCACGQVYPVYRIGNISDKCGACRKVAARDRARSNWPKYKEAHSLSSKIKHRQKRVAAAPYPPPDTCELCDTVFSEEKGRGPHWDHNHATGLFRGWLCNLCNTGLGKFHDDPGLLFKAVEYLLTRGSYSKKEQ